MKKYILSLLSLPALLVSCTSTLNKDVKYVKGPEGEILKQTFDSSRSIASEQEVSLENGTYINKGFYKEYFPNKKIKFLTNKIGDSIVGNKYFFYESGKIKTINVRTSEEAGIVNFDLNGKRNGVRPLLLIHSRDSFVTGMPMPFVTDACIFHGVNTSIQTRIQNEKGESVLDSTEKVVFNNTNLYGYAAHPYRQIFSVPGKYTCTSIAMYVDSLSGAIIANDTSTLNFIVKDIKR